MNSPINKVAHKFGKIGNYYAADCTCKKSKIVLPKLSTTDAKEFEAGNFIPAPIECVKCKRLIQLTKPKNAKAKGSNN